MDYGRLTSSVGISSSYESIGCVSLSHRLKISYILLKIAHKTNSGGLQVDFEPSDSLTPCQSAILPSRWGEWIVMVPKIHISQYVRGNNEFP